MTTHPLTAATRPAAVRARARSPGNGGGATAVSSQSAAAGAVLDSGVDVVGIGSFTGRESEVTADWLAQRVADGSIRWVVVSGDGGGMPNDSRSGSSAAMAAVSESCTAVPGVDGLYDCAGAASALAAAGRPTRIRAAARSADARSRGSTRTTAAPARCQA